ncbi:MAG: MBOAT family protein [Chitinophagaceae bacterium]|nr:MBOAT family protein [Chitinophagaceae bacterium]
MIFNSVHFIFFFIATTILYYALPHRFRWAFLLAISCYFYMVFRPIYILILAGTIVVDYVAGLFLESTTNPRRKKIFLVASIIANVGVLAVFKYYNFINDNLTELLGVFHLKNEIPMLRILLPIGLSFHTFQAMSYTIEVYRGKQQAEKHFGMYALYVMFYPQLVAGPIERPQNILHQLKEKVVFNYDHIVSGLKLILWGLFVKVVIADRLSIYVDIVYNSPEHHSAISSLVATLFFTFQIYCDFSGYSSIAIGCAKVLGIDLMINFRRPYMSTSIREFWSRWHISLSTWFRDYLYIPLGGNRVSVYRNMFNLFFVFLVSGLWHGANWTFIIWGALHGLYLMMEIVIDRLVPSIKLPRSIRWILNFVLVAIAWIFFRASNFQTAKQILKNIYTFKPGPLYIGNASYLVYSFFAILFLFAAEYNAEKLNNRYAWLYSERKVLRWSAYLLLILTLLSIGVFNGGQFIYFQF